MQIQTKGLMRSGDKEQQLEAHEHMGEPLTTHFAGCSVQRSAYVFFALSLLCIHVVNFFSLSFFALLCWRLAIDAFSKVRRFWQGLGPC